MTLAIIILVYYIWIVDMFKGFKGKKSTIAVSGALVTLISWQCTTPWGIVMCYITTLITIVSISIYIADKYY